MIRWPGLSLLFIVFSFRVLAIDAVVSHSTFYEMTKGEGAHYIPVIEINWQVNPRQLHYTTTPEKAIVARIRTDVYLTNDEGLSRDDHFILQTVPRTSISDLALNSIIELRRYNFVSGHVRVKLVMTDLADSLRPFVYSDTFSVAPAGSSAFYSNMQILDTAVEGSAATEFSRNGRMQLPSCTNFLDEPRSTLMYYTELYHTIGLPKTDYPLIQHVFITRKENEGHYGELIRTDTISARPSMPVTGSFKIAGLPSGNYYLQATLENDKHRVLATTSLFFQRLNRHPVEEVDTSKKKMTAAANDTGLEQVNLLDLNKTFVAKYKLGEIREILRMLLPVSDPLGAENIKNFLKKPDELYMRYFVYNFFLARNKEEPEKAWREYSAKVIEVNKLFSGHGHRGYESERGFIYLRYGAPTDIITVENEPGALPYEIWQYNTLTQMNRKSIPDALFLFYRQQPTSDFRLLHSTVDGEVQTPGWRSYLYTNQDASGNSNSRADQYIGNR